MANDNKAKREAKKQLKKLQTDINKIEKQLNKSPQIINQTDEQIKSKTKQTISKSLEPSLKGTEPTLKGLDFSIKDGKTLKEEQQNNKIKQQQRKGHLSQLPPTPSQVEDEINQYDTVTRERIENDDTFAQSFYIGELIEQQIYDICDTAQSYGYTNKGNIQWVRNKIQEAKQQFGEELFYQNLWDKQGEILETVSVIVFASEQEQVDFDMNKLLILLFDVPVNEQNNSEEV